MNKKTYNTPITEVTHIDMDSFLAASPGVNANGTSGNLDSNGVVKDADADEACGKITINDVWE